MSIPYICLLLSCESGTVLCRYKPQLVYLTHSGFSHPRAQALQPVIDKKIQYFECSTFDTSYLNMQQGTP